VWMTPSNVLSLRASSKAPAAAISRMSRRQGIYCASDYLCGLSHAFTSDNGCFKQMRILLVCIEDLIRLLLRPNGKPHKVPSNENVLCQRVYEEE
jgi:hypothetical protein